MLLVTPQFRIVAELLSTTVALDARQLPYDDRYGAIDDSDHLPMVRTQQMLRHLEVPLTLELTEATPELARSGHTLTVLGRVPVQHKVGLAVGVEFTRLTLERCLQYDAVHVPQYQLHARRSRMVQSSPVVIA
uniref:Putative secreted protein n=1 Tax=Anopheles darlingi TaxID=43151 RepID=A0A2M4D8S5_ANODA